MAERSAMPAQIWITSLCRLASLLTLIATGLAGCAGEKSRFHDPELVEFNEKAGFDADSLERWNLYLTRLSIGVSGQWPDLESGEVKRRLLGRLEREHASVRTRVIVLLWQHYPEAYDLLAARKIPAGSCIDDAILLTTVIQRHSGGVSTDPSAQSEWERYVAALASNPVRLNAAWRRIEPYVGRTRPAPGDLVNIRELAAEQERRAPGPGIALRSTSAFWNVLVAAAQDRTRGFSLRDFERICDEPDARRSKLRLTAPPLAVRGVAAP